MPGFGCGRCFLNLAAYFYVVSPPRKREVFLKVEPKKSSLAQDVGLRQRGLGGIPVEEVSGTCRNHRLGKVTRFAAVSEHRAGFGVGVFFALTAGCFCLFEPSRTCLRFGGQLTCVSAPFVRCLVVQPPLRILATVRDLTSPTS